MKMLLLLLLVGCGTENNNPPYYSMTWSCGNNNRCASNMKSWSGAGSFTNESDCLVWETAFINNYQNSSVTACTYHSH